ncbi:MAG: carbohydrate binding domain-containing protein [Muribaculaceae bacterium]|nr:carbohydrate binding domain-containing protein [Muribaculaceae bacterium]
MRKLSFLIFVLLPFLANAVDLFYYSPESGEGGLRFAIRNNKGHWEEIGHNFNFVSSDFGAWGSGKKMFNPVLIFDKGEWKLIFAANKKASVYGMAETADLINWRPQEYITDAEWLNSPLNPKDKQINIKIGKHKHNGRIIDVDDTVIKNLKAYVTKRTDLQTLYSETTREDDKRFKNLDNIKGTLKIYPQTKEISPLLLGIFFEDINYAADGGLYGELIQNRDFEYKQGEAHNKEWDADYGWQLHGKDIRLQICNENPISLNNPHYARITILAENSDDKNGLINEGFDGITLKKGEAYKFKVTGRSSSEMLLEIELLSKDQKVITQTEIIIEPGDEWKDYSAIFNVPEDYSEAMLKISPRFIGEVDLDMISLFPENTYKGRENGLRKDLAETLAALKPRFVRFPGGCVAHGNGLDNSYDWKGSIGPLKDRKPLSNLWGYHQTRGLGYHEYFLFCEDIGAEPLPVLAAGVPCQNSSNPSRFTVDDITLYGQQQGVPIDSMGAYIQDIIDLIEYANGPVSSEWGSRRAEAGHPEPFNLKYIGIGNEDMITEVFKERFELIQDAIKRIYPEITIIGTTGPFYEGADYVEGWNFARKRNVDMVDEHYYVEPAWLIYNQNFYDNYDREGPKVYLGEWAAHLPDRSSTIETALAEALYITALERNGDVVRMSSYAPLLAKKGHTQWRPDLIYFDNDSVYPTTDYQMMRLAGENSGDRYVYSKLDIKSDNDKVKARVAASVVNDSTTGETILKLVNMLPVETDINIEPDQSINLTGLYGRPYKVTTLSGRPDQTEADIKEDSKIFSDSDLEITLPPYSFTIIRI